ncbi:unnamed protein product [Trichobilharzia regenti]|nr:unnamed protein product [Trichobilharzia regenti]
MQNIQSLDEYPELSMLLNSSSALSVNEISELCNRLTVESINAIQGNLEDINCNKDDGDGDKSGSSLTLCAKSPSTSSSSPSSPPSPRHGYASLKGIKQNSDEEVKRSIKQSFKQKALNEQYLRNSVEDDDFQRRNSLSNMQNSIYSFSDADSSFSGYFNNVSVLIIFGNYWLR